MIIKCENLSYKYDSTNGISDISTEFKSGNIYGLIGPSGAGKSTLIKLISGNIKPKTGNIKIDDKEIDKYTNKEKINIIAWLPQTTSCNFDYTCKETILFGRYGYSNFLPSKNDYEICNEIMQEMNITHLANRYLSSISGGEFQRIMIAQTIAQNAKCIILDEPISHLDIKCQSEIMEYLQKKTKEQKSIIIISVHDLTVASYFCDYIILLKKGKKIAEGKTKDVINYQNILNGFDLETNIIDYNKDKFPIIKKI